MTNREYHSRVETARTELSMQRIPHDPELDEHVNRVFLDACGRFHLRLCDVCGPGKQHVVAEARHWVSTELRRTVQWRWFREKPPAFRVNMNGFDRNGEWYPLSYPVVARLMNLNHSTLVVARQKHQALLRLAQLEAST